MKELNIPCDQVFKGYTYDVYSTLNTHDVYVMPSVQEGFPNALSEAMAIGMPCIATSCHPGIEQLISHGKTGLLVTPQNSEELRNGMKFMIENPNAVKEFGELAKVAVKKYNVESVVVQWQELLERVNQS